MTFWNPFGNRYTPKGPPGLQSEYVTEHGRFTMPLAEAVMWFGSFSIETAKPPRPPIETPKAALGERDDRSRSKRRSENFIRICRASL